MNLGELYDYINYISNKEVSGNTLTPEQYNTVLKAVNIEFLKLKLGLPEEYQFGITQPRQAYEISRKITEDIRHLKVWMGEPGTSPLAVNSNGIAIIPSDHAYPSSVRYRSFTNTSCDTQDENVRTIEILYDDQLGDRLGNSIKNPTLEDPICSFYDTFIQFYPKNLKWVDYTYIRHAATPVFAYTIENDTVTYDPANSTELDWPEQTHVDIARLILSKIGINLKDVNLVQYEEMKKKEGI